MKYNGSYFMCECGGETLYIEKYNDPDLPPEYWIALYRLGCYKRSLKNRIKWAWKILWKGDLWIDQVTLSQENIDRLGEFIKDS